MAGESVAGKQRVVIIRIACGHAYPSLGGHSRAFEQLGEKREKRNKRVFIPGNRL